MALSSLTCPPPIRRATRTPKRDYALLESAIELFDEGKFRESLQRTLEHLLAPRPVPDLVTETFTFPQGSSRVSVRLRDGVLMIDVPLVHLPTTGNSTAALRFLLTKISGSGQLHQPRLRGEDVYLEFRGKLSGLHPNKVVEAMRRMPVEADGNDDWMVDQFGAEPLDREPIAPLDDDDLAKAEATWRVHWGEVEELVKESQRKQSTFFLNEITAYAVYHLRRAVPVVGALGARIAESARTFNDTDEDPTKREAALTKCAKEMKGVSKEELARSLGHAEYTITPLADGTPAVLASYLGAGDYVDAVGSARSSGRVMDAAVALFGTYNYLLARFSWSEEIEALLQEGLAQASGKPWREAANTLWAHGKSVVASFDEEEPDGEGEAEGEGAEQELEVGA